MHINAHRAGFVLGVLIVVQYGELRGTAQGMPSVRVIPAEAKVFARPEVNSDVVTVTHAGAVLDLIDRGEGWYWVLSGRDQNGSRQSGWIQADQVAIATAPVSRDSLRTLHEELSALPKAAGPPLPRMDSPKTERAQARKAAGEARAAARLEEAARIDSGKAEREQARQAAGEARAAARLEEAARIDSRKAEREQARKAAEEARAAARLEEAARNVEEARRKYEGLTKKPE